MIALHGGAKHGVAPCRRIRLLAGPAVALTRSLELGHGYWLVLTLAVVLQPASAACRIAARARLVGTLAGVVLSIVLVLALPAAVTLAVAALCAVLAAAWGIAQDVERQTLFVTPVVVLLGSGGGLEDGVDLSVERLALTPVAVVLALGAAAVLNRLEEKDARSTS